MVMVDAQLLHLISAPLLRVTQSARLQVALNMAMVADRLLLLILELFIRVTQSAHLPVALNMVMEGDPQPQLTSESTLTKV